MKITRNTFQDHARKKQKTFGTAQAIDAAYAAFPDLQDRLFFVDLESGRFLQPQKDTGDARRIMLENRDLGIAMHEYLTSKSSGCYRTGGMIYCLLYQSDDISARVLGEKAALGETLHFVFHHELAHVVKPYPTRNAQFQESLADSFAVLRRIQDYGAESGTITGLVEHRRAREQEDYNTCAAVTAAAAYARAHDIAKLSQKATLDLAEILTREALSRKPQLKIHPPV